MIQQLKLPHLQANDLEAVVQGGILNPNILTWLLDFCDLHDLYSTGTAQPLTSLTSNNDSSENCLFPNIFN